MRVSKFKVGEIAIWVLADDPQGNGQECTITGPLEFATARDRIDGSIDSNWGYDVEDAEGRWFAFENELAKRKPPRDDLSVVRWADCPWQPERVRA